MSDQMNPDELEKFIHRELRSLPPRKAPAGFESRVQAAVAARLAARTAPTENLEQFVHRELRALPLRKAPRSLESRVLAAIEQQAAVAWYHKSWSYWPATVRAAFLGVATSIAGIAMAAFYLFGQGAEASAMSSAAGERFAGVMAIVHVFRWMAAYVNETIASVPPLWLYGGLAFVAALYATFFGLGAAAYRTLYRNS